MKIQYQEFNFRESTQTVIDHANNIIAEYSAQGYTLTLRQLYYQFVSRDLIRNSQKEYDRLGSIINDARLAGEVDWEAIIDLTREMTSNSHWDSPRDIVAACATQYQIDKWSDQPNYVEVWIEKDALGGVFEPECRKLDVPFFSCRGYTSQSAMWAAGQRLAEKADTGKQITILHFGDHDPSGIDMSRDIEARLGMFMHSDPDSEMQYRAMNYMTNEPWEHEALTVKRIALNRDQIRRYNPPPNPAKITDSRAKGYIREHGTQSWELDALEPRVLAQLVQANVKALRDEDLWNDAVRKQTAHREAISAIVSKLPK
jgi:hypothetical protein